MKLYNGLYQIIKQFLLDIENDSAFENPKSLQILIAKSSELLDAVHDAEFRERVVSDFIVQCLQRIAAQSEIITVPQISASLRFLTLGIAYECAQDELNDSEPRDETAAHQFSARQQGNTLQQILSAQQFNAVHDYNQWFANSSIYCARAELKQAQKHQFLTFSDVQVQACLNDLSSVPIHQVTLNEITDWVAQVTEITDLQALRHCSRDYQMLLLQEEYRKRLSETKLPLAIDEMLLLLQVFRRAKRETYVTRKISSEIYTSYFPKAVPHLVCMSEQQYIIYFKFYLLTQPNLVSGLDVLFAPYHDDELKLMEKRIQRALVELVQDGSIHSGHLTRIMSVYQVRAIKEFRIDLLRDTLAQLFEHDQFAIALRLIIVSYHLMHHSQEPTITNLIDMRSKMVADLLHIIVQQFATIRPVVSPARANIFFTTLLPYAKMRLLLTQVVHNLTQSSIIDTKISLRHCLEQFLAYCTQLPRQMQIRYGAEIIAYQQLCRDITFQSLYLSRRMEQWLPELIQCFPEASSRINKSQVDFFVKVLQSGHRAGLLDIYAIDDIKQLTAFGKLCVAHSLLLVQLAGIDAMRCAKAVSFYFYAVSTLCAVDVESHATEIEWNALIKQILQQPLTIMAFNKLQEDMCYHFEKTDIHNILVFIETLYLRLLKLQTPVIAPTTLHYLLCLTTFRYAHVHQFTLQSQQAIIQMIKNGQQLTPDERLLLDLRIMALAQQSALKFVNPLCYSAVIGEAERLQQQLIARNNEQYFKGICLPRELESTHATHCGLTLMNYLEYALQPGLFFGFTAEQLQSLQRCYDDLKSWYPLVPQSVPEDTLFSVSTLSQLFRSPATTPRQAQLGQPAITSPKPIT